MAEHTGGGDPPYKDGDESPGGSEGGDPPGVGADPGLDGSKNEGTVAVELFECSPDAGSYHFRAPFRSDVVRADMLTGNSVRSIRVNGSTVQNPAFSVNDGQPRSIVHLFFCS